MKIVTTVAFLHLWSYATAGVSGSTETVVTASPGDIALLPCYTAGNVTPSLTTWMKNGGEVIISGGPSTPTPTPTPPAVQRLIVLHDGSLNIQGVRAGDEGSYLCNSSMQGNITFHGRVLLQVVSGPENVTLSVGAATALPNGTLYTCLGSTVNFNCSGSSYPSQQLTLAFRGASSSNDSLVSTSGSWLDYKITDIQPSAQGVYSCLAQNPVSGERVNKSTELLVYYVPDRHPQCMWVTAQDPYHIVFNCSWFGAYPTPTLRWDEEEGKQGGQWKGRIYATETADSLSVTLNRSQLFDGQTVRCLPQHPALRAGDEEKKKCVFTLQRPFPEGDPLVTALEASSVTLTCTDERSVPSSNTTWRKGLQQDEIVPGSKYLLSQEGYTWKLTILNVSKDDEGPYFCRSENPLDVRELEVYLTVKTSSAYTGAIIGVFIAAVIVGSAIIIAKTVYSSRHRICLGGGFGQVEDDRGDVLSLVESDDEQMFQDAVPRLPPLTNGQHTTLVQIHRIPSSDHEDAETTDTSSQQQQQQQQQHEETKLTEEPVESLVTF